MLDDLMRDPLRNYSFSLAFLMADGLELSVIFRRKIVYCFVSGA